MKTFTLVAILLLSFVITVMSTDIATFISNLTPTTQSTGSSSGSTISRISRDDHDHDHDNDKDGDDDDKEKKQDDSESGASRALRILRQHRTPSSSMSTSTSASTSTKGLTNKRDDDEPTTTRRSRQVRAAQSSHSTRQADPQEVPEAEPGAPGAPGGPVSSAETGEPIGFSPPVGVPQSTGRQVPPRPAVPRPAPRPVAPPPPPSQGGEVATLTLPDGADLIVGDIKPGFTCQSKIYGYYADIYNDCKLFHVCVPVGDENGVTNPIQWSFVCGNQTLFNQEKLTCDHVENVDCSKSENFYSINENFGRPEDKIAAQPGQPAPPPAPTRG